MKRVVRFTLLAAFSALSAYSVCQGIQPEKSVEYARLYSEVETAITTGSVKPETIEKMKRMIAIYDQNGDIRFQLAIALVNSGKYEESLPHYEAALKLGAFANKFEASVYYDMACAYAKTGQKEKAFQFVQLALDKGFRDIEHLRTDGDLESLHADKRWAQLSATADVKKMTRDQAWRYDIWFANRELRRIHLNPYRFHTPKEFDTFVKALDRDVPKLSDAQITARIQELFQLAGDGHTGIRPGNDSPLVRRVGLQFFAFSDGIFVTLAEPSLKEFAGAKLLAVEGKPVQEVMDGIAKYTHHDNDQSWLSNKTIRLTLPAFLNGAGFAKKPDEVTFTFQLSSGETKTHTFPAITTPPAPTWISARAESKNPVPLYIKNQQAAYFAEEIPELDAMYVQYNAVRSDPAESLPTFCKRVFETMDAKNIQRLILDVRWNGGGNSFLNRSIHEGIMRRERLNKKGNLFVITGRNTFSAAQNFTTDITRFANPILVGEPTGSSPNFVGESIRITLPYSKMTGTISDLYWQRSWPMDHRTWLAPNLPAPPVFSLFKDNRDPAMEAITAFLKG